MSNERNESEQEVINERLVVSNSILLSFMWITSIFLLYLLIMTLIKVCRLRKADKEKSVDNNIEMNTITTQPSTITISSIPYPSPLSTTTPIDDECENSQINSDLVPNQTEDCILTPTDDYTSLNTPKPITNTSPVDLSIDKQLDHEKNDIEDNLLLNHIEPFFRRTITCSIGCFALSSLFASIAITLEIIHKQGRHDTMHQIAMVLMNVGRRLMFAMFIGRLYYTFKGNTDLLYPMNVYKCLFTSFILEWIYFLLVCGTLFIIYGFLPSANPKLALPVSGIAMIWDLINFLVVARLFARSLWTLFYQTLNDCIDGNEIDINSKNLVYLVMKYRILIFWAVVSSIIVMIVLIIQISTENHVISLFIIVVLHNCLNSMCLYANFEFSHTLYDKMFNCCHNISAKFGLWKAIHLHQIDESKITSNHIDHIVLRNSH